MTVEVIDLTIVDALPEAESLETYLLAILERHDGLCLDTNRNVSSWRPPWLRH